MAKMMKAATKDGQRLWVITPNLNLVSYLRSKRLSYLDVFFIFGQHLFHIGKLKDRNESDFEQLSHNKVRIMLCLDNKLVKLREIEKQMVFAEHKLKKRKDQSRNIYDYKPYQVFIGLTENYLDTLHSIRDTVLDIDRSLDSGMLSEDIWAKEWFRLQIDLRNIFHHVESPLCLVEKKQVQFVFKKLPKRPKYFDSSMKDPAGNYIVELELGDLSDNLFRSLNLWAKEHLKELPDNTDHQLTVRLEKDGRMKSRKVSLGKIRKLLN